MLPAERREVQEKSQVGSGCRLEGIRTRVKKSQGMGKTGRSENRSVLRTHCNQKCERGRSTDSTDRHRWDGVGEGAQRERAVISHVGGDMAGAGDITIRADFNVENLSVRSDEDIERIEEAFRRNVDGLSEKVAGHLRRFS